MTLSERDECLVVIFRLITRASNTISFRLAHLGISLIEDYRAADYQSVKAALVDAENLINTDKEN